MATTDTELRSEVRVLTGYSQMVLSNSDLDTVITRAKRHIKADKGFESSYDFYANEQREDALFWWSCLFAKVAAGELDSQSINVAAVDVDTLLAKDDDEITTWYRNAAKAMRNLKADGEDFVAGQGVTSPVRDGRTYGEDDSTGLGEGL